MSDLGRLFGGIDIYLFDQIMRGRLTPGSRVLDAACGGGRNLVYLLQAGYDVFAVDSDASAVEAVRQMAATLAPHVPPDNFRVEAVEQMSFTDAFADVVLSSAVLHFARDDRQFEAMVARDVACSEARRHVVLPPRFVDRNGRADASGKRPEISAARWQRALSR